MQATEMYPGRRIGAILSMRGDEVRFLGYGVYEGDFLPPGISMPSFDELLASLGQPLPLREEEMRQLYVAHFAANGFMQKVRLQPRLRLDNGDFVWAGECHWEDETTVRKWLAGKSVIHVRLIRDNDGRVCKVLENAPLGEPAE